MSHTITLQLPDETVRRFRRGARAAHKSLAEFLVERLRETTVPLADDVSSPMREELEALERLDDQTLWAVARSQLLPAQQRTYNRLLRKNGAQRLNAHEQEQLRGLGDAARRLTLQKSHAVVILKWRGHVIPTEPDLSRAQ